MDSKRDVAMRENPSSFRLTTARVIFIVLFTVVCYLLARSMMHHHFMDGGRYNNQTQH